MASEYQFKLTQKAERDIDEIVYYMTSELSNPQAAGDFMDALQAKIKETRLFPESGEKVDNEFLPVDTIRKKIVRHYVMYYFADHQTQVIYVLRVVYGRRNLEEIVRNL